MIGPGFALFFAWRTSVMKKVLLIALALILVLPAASALAQRGGGGHGGSHGGGSHSGGSHSGGVSRGSGSGSGAWHGGRGSHGGGFHGGHRGGRFIYVSPFWDWGWGWGYGWSPYYYGAFYYGRGYGAGYGNTSDWAVVDTDVSPEEARVYLDGRYIGTADDFDGYPDYLYLRPGQYKLEFRLEGYESQSVTIDAKPGVKVDLNNKLRKIPGGKQRGSYDTPAPQGGIQRYWGKRRGELTPYDSDGPPSRDRRDRNAIEARPDRHDADADDDDDSPPSPPPAAASSREERPREEGWRRQAQPESVRPKQARLRFQVQPGDAAVYLDDRFLGIAQELDSVERGIPLAAGKHTVMVSRPGLKDRTVEVEVTAGESKEIEISLNK
jgi:hypothetical protein